MDGDAYMSLHVMVLWRKTKHTCVKEVPDSKARDITRVETTRRGHIRAKGKANDST